MTEDSTSTVRALAWSSKMRGTTGGKQSGWWSGGDGGRNGELELWKRGRLQWLASIDLPCGAILPPYATGVDHPSATPSPPCPPPPAGVTPLEAEADILKNDSESHRGPHWRFLTGSTRPPGPPAPDIPLFFAFGLSHSQEQEKKKRTRDKKRENYRGKRRGNKWARSAYSPESACSGY